MKHMSYGREFWTCLNTFRGLGVHLCMTAFTSGLLTNTTYAKRTHNLSQSTPPCCPKFTYVGICWCKYVECDRAITLKRSNVHFHRFDQHKVTSNFKEKALVNLKWPAIKVVLLCTFKASWIQISHYIGHNCGSIIKNYNHVPGSNARY